MKWLYIYGGEGWLRFPDLWSDRNPDGTNINTCGEFRWSPEGPVSQIHSPHLLVGAPRIFLDLLRFVQVRKATGGYRTYSSLVKLQPRFLSLQWKTCLWAELQPWCLSLLWRTCPWTEHWWYIYLGTGWIWTLRTNFHRLFRDVGYFDIRNPLSPVTCYRVRCCWYVKVVFRWNRAPHQFTIKAGSLLLVSAFSWEAISLEQHGGQWSWRHGG